MDLLGWPSDELLRHRRERIIYGVELAAAPGDYLLRRQSRPDYLFDPSLEDDVARISDWVEDALDGSEEPERGHCRCCV